MINKAFNDCIECDCNQHSEKPCDPESGICECEHNTAGSHCEQCAEGFFGNSRDGKQSDCQGMLSK